jgi:hypothetical protein
MKLEMKKSIIFCVLIFVAIGCSPSSMGVKLTEINRYTSPDSRVDAVIVTSDAGATTSIGHHIFIVPKGESPKDMKFSILTANHVVGLKVYWQQAKNLKITYQAARIFKFTNFWQSREIDNFQYEVKITETEQLASQGFGPKSSPHL